jgi:peptidoglycan glycosyltransferase
VKRPLRRIGSVVIGLIVLLLANLTYLQVVKAADFRADPNNKRTVLEEYSRARGQITAAGGAVLARSDPVNDQYRYQRVYPGRSVYANLTGYYSLRYGTTQLEQLQNSLLSGDSPDLWADQLSDLITGREPRGGNVQLTIVPAVQQAAFHGLADKGYVGAVVAIKPSTGQILAMATSPSYDPNPLASHNDEVQRKAYNAINSSKPSTILDRTIESVYPPGSTFKLVVTAAALQHGYTPSTLVTGASSIKLPGTDGVTLTNFDNETCDGSGGEPVTLTTALAFSCNTAYAEVGMNVGSTTLKKTAAAFGIDATAWDLDGFTVAGSRTGPMVDDAAVAQSSIGQRDVALTPMQNAIIAATIANHGERMEPYLVAATTRPDLSVISQASPISDGQAIPSAVADQIRDMMIKSESETTGGGQIAGLTIASKTGTAEHGTDPKNTPPHAWYVAFAPAENPQVAVAVLVENGGNLGLEATGGKVAAPIGRAVIAAALAAGR